MSRATATVVLKRRRSRWAFEDDAVDMEVHDSWRWSEAGGAAGDFLGMGLKCAYP
jgi:hypothetical protein